MKNEFKSNLSPEDFISSGTWQYCVELEKKVAKYKQLEEEIAKFYPEEEGKVPNGDLCDIGEIAASHFGFF